MLCDNCPLMFVERTSWDVEEYEPMCAVTMFPTIGSVSNFEDSGCHRTNKWIMSQSRDLLIQEHEARELAFLNNLISERGWDFSM